MSNGLRAPLLPLRMPHTHTDHPFPTALPSLRFQTGYESICLLQLTVSDTP